MAKVLKVRNAENTDWIEIASSVPDVSGYLTQSSASTQYEKIIPYQSPAPSNPSNGDLWVDSSTSPPSLKIYNGSVWVQLGSAVDDTQAIFSGRMFA